MIVTLVSQCKKNSLKRSRRILDSFADRIGDSTWQTHITQDGLNALRKLLRKTSSKNTAVSCHWIRGRSQTELLWVVGKKESFDLEGRVPVNITKKDVIKNFENDWCYMPLIRALTTFSALFHDWGKANDFFQKKLKKKSRNKDPLRHEWISCLLFHALVLDKLKDQEEENQLQDKVWLQKIAEGDLEESSLKENLKNLELTFDKSNPLDRSNPLDKLPPFASMIAWLILSHHRLPSPPKDNRNIDLFKKYPLNDWKELFKGIDSSYGYQNHKENTNTEDIKKCLEFKEGLLKNSSCWINHIIKWSKISLKIILQSNTETELIKENIIRSILFYARLSMMLGDHNYSSKDADNDSSWQSKLFANTEIDKNKRVSKLKQKLDEHLSKVSKEALKVIKYLPKFEQDMPTVQDEVIKALNKRSPDGFEWQDKASGKIKKWREEETLNKFGFFAVNIASTGKGKTIANAKIMTALSKKYSKLRYVLALGLRTLTLQTGKEYRNRLGMTDSDDLAVLIGSTTVEDLDKTQNEYLRDSGSESEEVFKNNIDSVYEYHCNQDQEKILKTVLKRKKDRELLYAPILVCTIDHIITATETNRGGRFILPSLRLMSSDLVIDEIDDFDTNDLKAIGRLIHLAGMLGRKVMISSATIPPDLAKGFYRAYQQGWITYSKSRGEKIIKIGCAWIDEYKTNVKNMTCDSERIASYTPHKKSSEVKKKRIYVALYDGL